MNISTKFRQRLNIIYPPLNYDYRNKKSFVEDESREPPYEFLWFGLRQPPLAPRTVNPEGWKLIFHWLVKLAKIIGVTAQVIVTIVPYLFFEAAKHLAKWVMEACQGNTADHWALAAIKLVGLFFAAMVYGACWFVANVVLDSIFSPFASIRSIYNEIISKDNKSYLSKFFLTVQLVLTVVISLAALAAVAYFVPPLLPMIFSEALPLLFWNIITGVGVLLLAGIGLALNKVDQHNLYIANRDYTPVERAPARPAAAQVDEGTRLVSGGQLSSDAQAKVALAGQQLWVRAEASRPPYVSNRFGTVSAADAELKGAAPQPPSYGATSIAP